jgi:mono/diheme cytochrome c family protein
MNRTRTCCLVAAFAGLTLAIGCTAQSESAHGSKATGASAAAAKPTAAVDIEKGRTIYKANCIACHGEGGKGDGPAAGALKPPPRDHTDPAYMNTLTDKNLADVIVMGGAIKGKPLMPSHPQLRGQDLDSLVAYVRSLSVPK